MRYFLRLALLIGCAFAGLPPAEARRVALVIGNAEYKVGPLANPLNDAAAVAEAFERQLKFDKVILKRNLGLDGFRAALREMAREARGAEFGIIYFAGHGIEVAGRNFLVPIDAALAAARDIDLEAIALDTVLGQLDGVIKLKLVILDACRNNPFPVAGAKRSVSRGLTRVEPEGNTLIAYAAKDGTTADDGTGRHSPFTAALLKRIVTPGLEVRRLFGYVSDDVLAATNRVQEPYLYGRLGGAEIFLHPQTAASPALPAPPAAAQLSEAERTWVAVKDSTSIAVLEAFRRQFGAANTVYDRLAEARIDALKKQQVTLAVPPQPKPALPKVSQPPATAPSKAVAPAVALSPSRATGPLTAAEERALRPKDGFKECDDCPEMVVVPAGSFMMGSLSNEEGRKPDEDPHHRVAISRPFAVGKFEVTFSEWDACVAAGGCRHRPDDLGWGRGRRPVIMVSWNDITKEYLPWLSRKTGRTYRLLSEAEWEYAARAGTMGAWSFDGDAAALCEYANHADQSVSHSGKNTSCNDGVGEQTAEAGRYEPNASGLHDMHGNVWEWVQDCWNGNYNGAPRDGLGWTTGNCKTRVLRGGSWADTPDHLRSAARYGNSSDLRDHNRGFRVARTLDR